MLIGKDARLSEGARATKASNVLKTLLNTTFVWTNRVKGHVISGAA